MIAIAGHQVQQECASHSGACYPFNAAMPKFAANLTMMYNEVEFLERFAAAAADGFKGVEFLFPYGCVAGDIKARLDRHGLTQVLFNCPPGDWTAGDRGIASLPGREEE